MYSILPKAARAALLSAGILAGGALTDSATADKFLVQVNGSFTSNGATPITPVPFTASFYVDTSVSGIVHQSLGGGVTATGYQADAISNFSISAFGQTFTNQNISPFGSPFAAAAVYFSQALANGATPSIAMALSNSTYSFSIGFFSAGCAIPLAGPCQFENQLSFLNFIPVPGGSVDYGGPITSVTVTAVTVPFPTFNASLQIGLDKKNPAEDTFALESSFTLASGAPAINPATQQVTLAVGPYSFPLPPFKQGPSGTYTFDGTVNGVKLAAVLAPTRTSSYAFAAGELGANLSAIGPTVSVGLTIGGEGGNNISVKPIIINY